MNCTRTCPKGLNPAKAIQEIKKLIAGEDIGRGVNAPKAAVLPAGTASVPKTRRPKGPFGSADMLRIHVGIYRVLHEVSDRQVRVTVIHLGRTR